MKYVKDKQTNKQSNKKMEKKHEDRWLMEEKTRTSSDDDDDELYRIIELILVLCVIYATAFGREKESSMYENAMIIMMMRHIRNWIIKCNITNKQEKKK